ncbi:hypothetical protein HOT75_gp072 [Gordonia phage Daredevil]|uniref:Uncharacterized protein n=1 Tax=Gordonia phage Daredevil TaxID=2283286 RepID=A0A345MIS8_9CAUD|nr:hypothetical protein HOT75_gp072 [Gordonia phage Daredevil]AXH70459.1 hypothetical protein SEA_DAREDEVIL_72 [Gordonia phage Daredevil]
MSTLAHVELRDDIEARIRERTDALDEASLRSRYLAVAIAFNKMMGLAVQYTQSGVPTGPVVYEALVAVQTEQARIIHEPEAWAVMEKP